MAQGRWPSVVGPEVLPFLDDLAVREVAVAGLAVGAVADFEAAALLGAVDGRGVGHADGANGRRLRRFGRLFWGRHF